MFQQTRSVAVAVTQAHETVTNVHPAPVSAATVKEVVSDTDALNSKNNALVVPDGRITGLRSTPTFHQQGPFQSLLCLWLLFFLLCIRLIGPLFL